MAQTIGLLPGDRVAVNYSWPAAKVTTTQNQNPPFDLVKGDEGVIISETAQGSGVFIVEFDKGPGHFIQVARYWLDLIPKAVTPPKVEAPKQCSCKLETIMAQGCVCGHIKRYVPPHKRIFEIKKEEAK